jgi:DNA-binding transcriptional ArsR family regulator
MKARRDVFQAIADPTRRAILTLLTAQALTPGVITASFDVSQQTISKHIQILTECELLTREHKGREIYYELNPKKMKEIADWLKPFQQIWENRFSKLDKILKRPK